MTIQRINAFAPTSTHQGWPLRFAGRTRQYRDKEPKKTPESFMPNAHLEQSGAVASVEMGSHGVRIMLRKQSGDVIFKQKNWNNAASIAKYGNIRDEWQPSQSTSLLESATSPSFPKPVNRNNGKKKRIKILPSFKSPFELVRKIANDFEFTEGRPIQADTRCREVIDDTVRFLRKNNVQPEDAEVVATGGLRSATNGKKYVQYARKKGLRIKVLKPAEESTLCSLATTIGEGVRNDGLFWRSFSPFGQPCLVVDCGGATFVWGNHILELGSRRLQLNHPTNPDAIQAAKTRPGPLSKMSTQKPKAIKINPIQNMRKRYRNSRVIEFLSSNQAFHTWRRSTAPRNTGKICFMRHFPRQKSVIMSVLKG